MQVSLETFLEATRTGQFGGGGSDDVGDATVEVWSVNKVIVANIVANLGFLNLLASPRCCRHSRDRYLRVTCDV